MDWYVIQAYSGYEQKVKAALEERISLNNLSETVFSKALGLDKLWITIEDDWIPTLPAVAIIKGIKKESDKKTWLSLK